MENDLNDTLDELVSKHGLENILESLVEVCNLRLDTEDVEDDVDTADDWESVREQISSIIEDIENISEMK